MNKMICALILVMGLGFLQGCANSASIKGMTTNRRLTQGSSTAKQPELTQKVGVESVTGGKKTNPLWTSQVSSESFEAALKESLKCLNLLATDKASYLLKAVLTKLDQPLFGLDMIVTANVQYTLTEVATGKIVFDQLISTPHKCTMGDAFVATTRLKLANEGAVRDNIEAILEKLETTQVSNVSLQ